MPYILDIETRPSVKLKELFFGNIKADSRLKDPEKIAKDIEEKKIDAIKAMSVDHDFSDILCVGIKRVGGEAIVTTFEEFVKWLNTEREEFKGSKNNTIGDTVEFITFNGKGFDIPVILKTAVKMGLKPDEFPYRRFLTSMDRYKAFGHIDLMEKVALVWDPTKKKSLDMYLQIYLGKKKKDIDFATASEEEVRAHCLEDITHTEELYLLRKDRLFLD